MRLSGLSDLQIRCRKNWEREGEVVANTKSCNHSNYCYVQIYILDDFALRRKLTYSESPSHSTYYTAINLQNFLKRAKTYYVTEHFLMVS